MIVAATLPEESPDDPVDFCLVIPRILLSNEINNGEKLSGTSIFGLS